METEGLKNAISQRKPATINPLAARGYYKDDVLAKMAADAGTTFEINLAPIIRMPASNRAQAFRELRIFLGKCIKAGAKFVVFSRSADAMDSKTPRELQAVCTEILGVDQHIAKAAVTPTPAV